MTRHCTHCSTPVAPLECYRAIDGESELCLDCYRAEIEALLRDSCADDPEDFKRLRRRIEDRLRKSPSLVLEIRARLGAQGKIRINDLI